MRISTSPLVGMLPVLWKDKPLENASLPTVLSFLSGDASEHYGVQRAIVANQDIYDHTVAWCMECNCKRGCEGCTHLPGITTRVEVGIEQYAGTYMNKVLTNVSIVELRRKLFNFSTREALWRVGGMNVHSEEFGLLMYDKLRDILSFLEGTRCFHYLTWIPERAYSERLALCSVDISSRAEIRVKALVSTCKSFISRCGILLGSTFFVPWVGPMAMLSYPFFLEFFPESSSTIGKWYSKFVEWCQRDWDKKADTDKRFLKAIFGMVQISMAGLLLKFLPCILVAIGMYMAFVMGTFSYITLLFFVSVASWLARKAISEYSSSYNDHRARIVKEITRARKYISGAKKIPGIVIPRLLDTIQITQQEQGTLISPKVVTPSTVIKNSTRRTQDEMVNHL